MRHDVSVQTPRDRSRLALAAALRLVVVAGMAYAVPWAIVGLSGGEDANIGAGLIGLGLAAFTVLVWSWLDGRRHGWSALWAWGLAVLVGTLVFGSREVWVAMEAAADPQGPTNIVLRTVISVLSLAVQTFVLAGVGVALGAGLGRDRAQEGTRSG